MRFYVRIDQYSESEEILTPYSARDLMICLYLKIQVNVVRFIIYGMPRAYNICQLPGAAEYTDCITLSECPGGSVVSICRIHRPLFCRGVRLLRRLSWWHSRLMLQNIPTESLQKEKTPPKSILGMTQNNLIGRFQ